ncbi:gluconokinase [Silene latifolia]|uniref:gluconokinase n=1 Tax=Silene latifolia TaxID=37657 RepID=UPI003D775E4A
MQHFANILHNTIPREVLSPLLSTAVCPPSEISFSQANALKFSATCCSPARNGLYVQSCIAVSTSPVNGFHLGVSCTSNSLSEMPPMVQDTGVVVVIMGVSGAGKSTIGNLLAEALNCPFLDADDFHPQSNKEKMSRGIPLSDDDRVPWLQVICQALKEYITCGKKAVLACSALRNTYREIIRTSDPSYVPGGPCSSLKFVLLDVPVEVLSDRLKKRLAGGQHFMPPNLLKSQLELLEIDASEGVVQVDATQTPSVIVDIIKVALSTQVKMV